MSKHERPMVRWYWERVGGTLCEEFQAVPATSSAGQRLIDAVILPGGQKQELHWREVDLTDRDVIVVQAKNSRLGMSLMGQTLFSGELVRGFGPHSVRSVALCRSDDAVLRPLLEAYPGMEVVVVPKHVRA